MEENNFNYMYTVLCSVLAVNNIANTILGILKKGIINKMKKNIIKEVQLAALVWNHTSVEK